MKGFPQLTSEDVEQLDALLQDFVGRSGILSAMLVERAGYLIQQAGGALPGDAREFASLSSNAFSAAQEMSRRLKENFFTHLRVSGTGFHTLIRHVDDSSLLVIVFDTSIPAEKVETEAIATVIGVFERLEIARQRAPNVTVDFADADAQNVTKFFKRMSPPTEPPTEPPTPPTPSG